jgi:hypothetical protein
MIDHVQMPSPVYEYKSASCVPYESMSHVSSCFSWWMKYIDEKEGEEEWRKMNIASQLMVILVCVYMYVILLIPQTCLYTLGIQLFACTSIIILPWTIYSHMNTVEFIWSWLRRHTIDWSLRFILKKKENTGEKKKCIIKQQLKVLSIRIEVRVVTLPVFPLRNK